MNKKAIGNFLKTLREEKKLTQIQMSQRLGGFYSDALISKWERAQSVPGVYDLKNLAEFFSVSIDEILNGERYAEINLEEKYFIFNNKWMSRYDDDDLYKIREEQELMIETRFKELLRKMVSVGLSLSEDREFDFIVTHFYQIFIPAFESVEENLYRNPVISKCMSVDDLNEWVHEYLPSGLSDIKFEIYKQTALMHNSPIEEKVWEAGKKFVFNNRQNIWDDINNVIEDREAELENRLNTLDDVEKDILLACLQRINVVNTIAIGSPRGKELYEKHYGHIYDEEQLTKRAIKLLIECGAKLNKALLGCWKVIIWEYTIIDKLEEIHKRYKAPLLVPICEDGRYQYFTVYNTRHNREKLGIKYENELLDESDYQKLERRMYAGEKTILKPYAFASASEEEDAFVNSREQMLNMSLKAYNESRDGKLTEELLRDLDSLSLEKIRKKYFPSEYKGQYIDDEKSMSPEEFKKKYYIEGCS